MEYEHMIVFAGSIHARKHFYLCIYRWNTKVKRRTTNFIKNFLVIVNSFNFFLAVSYANHQISAICIGKSDYGHS